MPPNPDDLVRSDPFTIGDLEAAAAQRRWRRRHSQARCVMPTTAGLSPLRYEAHPTASTTLASIPMTFGGCPACMAQRHCTALERSPLATLLSARQSAQPTGARLSPRAALVERVKVELPVWKLQRFSDGSQVVNCA